MPHYFHFLFDPASGHFIISVYNEDGLENQSTRLEAQLRFYVRIENLRKAELEYRRLAETLW